jgi:hypothetical protein
MDGKSREWGGLGVRSGSMVVDRVPLIGRGANME